MLSLYTNRPPPSPTTKMLSLSPFAYFQLIVLDPPVSSRCSLAHSPTPPGWQLSCLGTTGSLLATFRLGQDFQALNLAMSCCLAIPCSLVIVVPC